MAPPDTFVVDLSLRRERVVTIGVFLPDLAVATVDV